MKMFCRTDQKCICYLCSVDEHKGHDTVSAAAERTERQRELEVSRQNIQQRIQDREKDVKELQQEVEAINRSADKAVEDSEKIFSQLIRLIQKRSSDVKQQLRSQQETEVSRVKELQEKLEQEITELKRKDADLKQLSHTEDHTQFLHNYPSLSALSQSTDSSSIKIRPLRYFEDVTAAVSEVRDKLQDVLTEKRTNISLTVTEVDVLLPQPEPKTRAEFFKYSRPRSSRVGVYLDHRAGQQPPSQHQQNKGADRGLQEEAEREEQPTPHQWDYSGESQQLQVPRVVHIREDLTWTHHTDFHHKVRQTAALLPLQAEEDQHGLQDPLQLLQSRAQHITREVKWHKKGVQLDQETFSCSICLDLLKDPVAIPCGHIYCMNCIKSFWDGEDEKKIHSCPQCRQTFTPRPVLLKKHHKTESCQVLSGQCLASLTVRNTSSLIYELTCHLKKHKLVDPSKKLQENICSRHDEVMKIFCRTDQKCICYLCSVDEHKGHDTVSAAAERTERQRELEVSRQNIQQRIQDREKDVKELQQEVEAINRSADKAVEDSEKIFSQLIRLIQKRSSDVKQQLRSQQETEVSRVKELQEKLEQEITELKRKDADLKQLSHTEDHTQFLHNYPSLSALSQSTDSSSIKIRPLRYFEDVTVAVSEVRDKLQDVLTEKWTNISLTVLGPPESECTWIHRAGILSFYSISETMTLLHRVQTTFTQPLYAGLWFFTGYLMETLLSGLEDGGDKLGASIGFFAGLGIDRSDSESSEVQRRAKKSDRLRTEEEHGVASRGIYSGEPQTINSLHSLTQRRVSHYKPTRSDTAGRKDLRYLSFTQRGWSSRSLKELPRAVRVSL
ncbi:hypothetical protein L3Q82_021129 [Scortum barcoo]|uniref:Uncharacterized protein n=1 Tax=Scortum barcoo TaxID=214431 RepID=A0ACB8X2Q9_9TELE|nr:hypothetical protein L3Q82_021129 [Scortum barcoo]